MKTLTVIYQPPADFEAFLSYYHEVHLPLVRKIPGLAKVTATKINRTLIGDHRCALIAELAFPDEDTFRTAMKSPENAATAADLANFADGLASVMIGETLEIEH